MGQPNMTLDIFCRRPLKRVFVQQLPYEVYCFNMLVVYLLSLLSSIDLMEILAKMILFRFPTNHYLRRMDECLTAYNLLVIIQIVHDNSNTPNISFFIISIPFPNLWGHIDWSSAIGR
jgi:hypothetical protein